MTQYSTFYLGERLFGLPILSVREIVRSWEITPVPLAPAHFRGLMNLRGQTVTILDLGVRLGLEGRDPEAGSHVVVLSNDGQAQQDLAGFLVDSIGDVLEADPAHLEPAPANVFDAETRFLQGVVRTEAGLLVLLDLRTVLGHPSESALS